jgi:hypothetical protein
MKLVTSLDQLKVGTKIKLVAKSEKWSVRATTIKQLIKMKNEHGDGSIHGVNDTEVLIDKRKNRYFSFNSYLAKDSWVKECYLLNSGDER